MVVNTPSLFTLNTPYPIDSIASYQLSSNCYVVAIAYYELQDQQHPNQRIGGIQFGFIHYQSDDIQFIHIKQTTSYDVSTINSQNHPLLLAAIGSDGALHMYQVIPLGHCDTNNTKDHVHLSHDHHPDQIWTDITLKDITSYHSLKQHPCLISSVTSQTSSIIGVAMDTLYCQRSHYLQTVWTLSNGMVCQTDMSNPSIQSFVSNKSVPIINSWKAHDAEVWCIAIDPHSQSMSKITTGADDCCLKFWDTRECLHTTNTIPSMINATTHTMGVTSILHHETHPHIMFTGSYDETLRVWDKRNIHSPINEYSSLGGIWRIKLDRNIQTNRTRLLLAATHGGCEIIDCANDNLFNFQPLGQHTSHKSMAYGIASLGGNFINLSSNVLNVQNNGFILLSDNIDPLSHLFISGSFYDKKLAIWAV